MGYKTPLQVEHLWDVPPAFKAEAVCEELEDSLQATKEAVKRPQVCHSRHALMLLKTTRQKVVIRPLMLQRLQHVMIFYRGYSAGPSFVLTGGAPW